MRNRIGLDLNLDRQDFHTDAVAFADAEPHRAESLGGKEGVQAGLAKIAKVLQFVPVGILTFGVEDVPDGTVEVGHRKEEYSAIHEQFTCRPQSVHWERHMLKDNGHAHDGTSWLHLDVTQILVEGVNAKSVQRVDIAPTQIHADRRETLFLRSE